MTTFEARQLFRLELQNAYPPREVDAMWRIVLEEVLNYSPVDAVMRENTQVAEFFPARLRDIIIRLRAAEPLQYILGTARFHGHNFRVTPDTLIPRPETEQLVDIIIDREADRSDLRVLDACTGSGAIAVSLARALRFPSVTAFDNSRAALRVARENANALKADVTFFEADLYNFGSAGALQPVDILVSNPPYITQTEWASLEPNVRDHEPQAALIVPDDQPLKPYEALAGLAPELMREKARIYLEVDPARARDVARLLGQKGFGNMEILVDFRGKERFVVAQWTD